MERHEYCTHPEQDFCDCDWCRVVRTQKCSSHMHQVNLCTMCSAGCDEYCECPCHPYKRHMTPRQLAMRPHWYLFITRYCPVCGAEKNYRMRFYCPKPKPADCYRVDVEYDHCVELESIAYA